jgi:Lon protease-like protein
MRQFNHPEIIPAMVIPDTVFFPHTILPLYIFESHYREMIDEVLEGDRFFTILGAFPVQSDVVLRSGDNTAATLGFVRAAQTYEDGSSTILLEGLCRIGVEENIYDRVFPRVRIKTTEAPCEDPERLCRLRQQTLRLLERLCAEGKQISPDLMTHLRAITTPQAFVDHATASLVENADQKLKILQCADPEERYGCLMTRLKRELARIRLLNHIVGVQCCGDVSRN